MNEILTVTFFVGLLAAAIRMATPILFAALGELITEKSGVLNLGIEGIMFLGSLAGFLTVYYTNNLWLAILVAFLAGGIISVIHSFMVVTLGVSQHVSGIGLTIFSSGLTLFIYRILIGTPTIPPTISSFNPLKVPVLSTIPVLGEIFFKHYALTYIAVILVPVIYIVIYKTRWGLSLRSVGENPEAADSMGINVYKIRYICISIGGGLMSVGGAFLAIAQFNMFLPDIVSGRGWVAIALVVFGNWHPGKILLGALIFGGIDAFQLRLQAIGIGIPSQYFLLLPYLITIILLIIFSRNVSSPKALLKPYRRE